MQSWLDKESRKRADLGSSAQTNYACTTQPSASHASAYTGNPHPSAAVPFTCPVLPPPMTSRSLPVNANDIDEYSISFDNVIAYMQTYHPDPQVLDTLQMLRSTIRIRSTMIK